MWRIGLEISHRGGHQELTALGLRASRFHRPLPQKIQFVLVQTPF
jgi:hypothetical protein